MNPRLPAFAALAIALPLVLAGCGNKGPLVLSDPATETAVPAQPVAPPPAPPESYLPAPSAPAPTAPAAPAPPASATPAR